MNPARPAERPNMMPYCCSVLAANRNTPHIIPTMSGFDSALPAIMSCSSSPASRFPAPTVFPDSRHRRKRFHSSNGISEIAPKVNRVALKNNGDIDAMPCTWETNANPQISEVNTRHAIPAISCCFMSIHASVSP